HGGGGRVSLVRERYLRQPSRLEIKLQRLPGMQSLQTLIDQAGSSQLPYRVALLSLAFALAGSLVGLVPEWGLLSLPGAAFGFYLPIMWLRRQRTQRMDRFEEQLPDALTVAARAMRAGLPFTEAIKLVSQEMKAPASEEFGIVYTEINYGGDTRNALLGLMGRVPSMAVMALVTSIMIQRDTGGNLAELLDKLAGLVRQRFRFERTVRTLSAESRLTAWILSLLPFFMTGAIALINPGFMLALVQDPTGRKLIVIGLFQVGLGILWLRQIVNVSDS
ncbi:type II secretion system F family protein, partial [uncultured Thiodictyon sp.]|uniref:type II secretion system F family protein n=1 Tax=uncultured Thiodictyon sp. TaxID=1846217 RepID=UPI0025E7729A